MSNEPEVDYGPLAGLIGVWKGDKGLDVAPEPDGSENNPYHETITFTAIGDVTNAESSRQHTPACENSQNTPRLACTRSLGRF